MGVWDYHCSLPPLMTAVEDQQYSFMMRLHHHPLLRVVFVRRHHGAPSSPVLVNHINWSKSRITEEGQLVYSPKAIGFRSPHHYDAINIGNTVQRRFMGSDQEILIGMYWLVYFQQTPGGLVVARKYIKKAIKNGWVDCVKSIVSHR